MVCDRVCVQCGGGGRGGVVVAMTYLANREIWAQRMTFRARSRVAWLESMLFTQELDALVNRDSASFRAVIACDFDVLLPLAQKMRKNAAHERVRDAIAVLKSQERHTRKLARRR